MRCVLLSFVLRCVWIARVSFCRTGFFFLVVWEFCTGGAFLIRTRVYGYVVYRISFWSDTVRFVPSFLSILFA